MGGFPCGISLATVDRDTRNPPSSPRLRHGPSSSTIKHNQAVTLARTAAVVYVCIAAALAVAQVTNASYVGAFLLLPLITFPCGLAAYVLQYPLLIESSL